MKNPVNEPQAPWLETLLFMVVFYLVYLVIGYVLLVLGGIQLLVKLLAGEPQPEIQGFGSQLGDYLAQISCYISMRTTVKPYPFNDWPAKPNEDE